MRLIRYVLHTPRNKHYITDANTALAALNLYTPGAFLEVLEEDEQFYQPLDCLVAQHKLYEEGR